MLLTLKVVLWLAGLASFGFCVSMLEAGASTPRRVLVAGLLAGALIVAAAVAIAVAA